MPYHLLSLSEVDPEQLDAVTDSLFGCHAWLKVFESTYGLDYRVLYQNDKLLFPLAVIDSALLKKITCLPFSDFVRFNSVDPQSLLNALHYLESTFPEYHITYPSTFKPEDVPDGVDVKRSHCYHEIPIVDGRPAKKAGSFKNKINIAKRNGLSVRFNDSPVAVETFYAIYKKLRFGKFKSIPQPRELFENVHHYFISQNSGFFVESVHESKVISSALVLRFKDVLYYKYSCSLYEYLYLRPNNLMLNGFINHAAQTGCKAVDLGRSGLGEEQKGLRQFKKHMGGVQKPITTFTAGPDATSIKNEALATFIERLTGEIVEQDLSDEATSRLSKIIYPYFA